MDSIDSPGEAAESLSSVHARPQALINPSRVSGEVASASGWPWISGCECLPRYSENLSVASRLLESTDRDVISDVLSTSIKGDDAVGQSGRVQRVR